MQSIPSEDPYIKLSTLHVPGGVSRAVRGREAGRLCKQESLSCEVLHFADAEMPSDPYPYYVNIPKASTVSNIRAPPSNESDLPPAPSAISTPRPSHESEGETTDSEIISPAVRFRDAIETAHAGPSEVFEVVFDYTAQSSDELTLQRGTIVKLVTKETGEDDWYYGMFDGKMGLFPANYVKSIGTEARRIPGDEIEEICKIGSGAFADVYKARWKNVDIALKKPLQQSKIESLKREAVRFNCLKHPNIVELFGICLEAPHIGLVLELCEGNTLASVYKRVEKAYVSARILVDWALQISSAMQHLTEHGFVHRDLKADNVLVKENVCICALHATTPTTPTHSCTLWMHGGLDVNTGQCEHCGGSALDRLTLKITDFGLMSEAGDKRSSVAGTSAWMAPETFKISQYGEASDVWSFGVTLWELLTRKVPYEGMEEITVLFMVCRQQLSLPIPEDCPTTMKNILKSCWEIEPERRPKFAELHESLSEYKEELMRDAFSKEQEELVQRLQSGIVRDLNSFYDDIMQGEHMEDTTKFRAEYERLMQEAAASDEERAIQEANRIRMNAPNPKARQSRIMKKETKAKAKKLNKNDIGKPEDFKHCISVRPRTSSHSPHGSTSNFEVYKFDMNGNAPGGARILQTGTLGRAGASHFVADPNDQIWGTLPRVKLAKGRPLDGNGTPASRIHDDLKANGHKALGPNLSISSPNLHDVNKEDKSLRRNNGVRRKHKKSTDDENCTQPEGSSTLSALATPRREPAKVNSKRRSHDGTLTGKVRHAFEHIPKFWSKNRQDSHNSSFDGEDNPATRSPSVSDASHRRILMTGISPRSPAQLGLLGDAAQRPRGYSMNDEALHKTKTPTKGKYVMPTDRTTHFVKQPLPSTSTSSSSGTLTRPRQPSGAQRSPVCELGIDDKVPRTPPEHYDISTTELMMRHMRTPSSEDSGKKVVNGYELLRNAHSNHPAPSHSPYDRIPPSHSDDQPTHERIEKIRPKLNDVIPMPAYSRTTTEVSNNPYITMTPSANRNPPRQNHEYACNQPYQMLSAAKAAQKIQRPDSLNLTRKQALTPGESGISTAGSSLFSDSLPLDEALPPPTSQAPPPPIIPPRTGTVPL